uniref:PDZ domain-containing protein n=1 Tax=Timema tahoe TaxID=61484 RepID=A0A7R9NX57_9NEOP|nr:unnamed protein product [Timema tahoe]
MQKRSLLVYLARLSELYIRSSHLHHHVHVQSIAPVHLTLSLSKSSSDSSQVMTLSPYPTTFSFCDPGLVTTRVNVETHLTRVYSPKLPVLYSAWNNVELCLTLSGPWDERSTCSLLAPGLMNDHKAIMKEIEQGMFSVFSQIDTASSTSNIDRTRTHTEPIARVSMVYPNSPAEKAGIIADDLIIEFGSVNAGNFKTLQDIGTVTHYSVGKNVKLFINRENRFITLSLTPSPWSGQGLLGCNILPVERVER